MAGSSRPVVPLTDVVRLAKDFNDFTGSRCRRKARQFEQARCRVRFDDRVRFEICRGRYPEIQTCRLRNVFITPKLCISYNCRPAECAYRLIKDELALDGNPLLNLASYVTTYMEPQAEQLMHESMRKNFIDAEEYP